MNARPTLSLLLIIVIATCAACDRRVSTGTSDVNREGQGDRPETAQDLRETATTTPESDPNAEVPATAPSPEAPAAPPVGDAPPGNATTQQDEGDTLGRP